jgi:hypothetical protein
VDWRATGAMLQVPYYLALKAEALYLADRTSEALEGIREAETLIERSEERWWCAELYRLRGVFLAAMGFRLTPCPRNPSPSCQIIPSVRFWQNSVECAVTAILAWRSEKTAFVSL